MYYNNVYNIIIYYGIIIFIITFTLLKAWIYLMFNFNIAQSPKLKNIRVYLFFINLRTICHDIVM